MQDILTEEEIHFFNHMAEEVSCAYPPVPEHISANERRVCVDIGANVGAFSFYASPRYDHVLALEPVDKNYKMLKKVKESEGLHNVDLLQMAVGASDSVDREIYVDSTLSGDCSLYNAAATPDADKQTINMVSYRSLLSIIHQKYGTHEIDYLKVDCEGGEYEFLWQEDLSNIKTIIMEVHGIPPALKGSGITEQGFIEHLLNYFTPTAGCAPNLFVGRNPRYMSTKELQALRETSAWIEADKKEYLYHWAEFLYDRQKRYSAKLVEAGYGDADVT